MGRLERLRVMPQSLRMQLLGGLLVPLGVIVFVNLSLARHNAAEMADLVLDRALLLSASAIADHVRADGRGGFDVYIPPFALGELRSLQDDIMYYRVSGPRGRLLAGYSDIPFELSAGSEKAPRYVDRAFHGGFVRFVALRQVVFSSRTALFAYVIVGETLHSRDAMIWSLEQQAAAQQGLLVIIAAALAWLGLRRDLAPLIRLGKDVKGRSAGDLAPLPTATVQRELRPFVSALNDHLARQRAQLEAQRRFAANAAHQLRTPLTLLRMQADFALREADSEKSSGAIAALTATTDRMTRLTKQLLRLSEAESQSAAGRLPVDLGALVREVLESYAGLALARNIDLGFDPELAQTVFAAGDPTMLRELVLNLVDNALRYVPAGGVVTVSVGYDADRCALRVEDNGPGIPARERAFVFERFYRILGNGAEGSGLGLAIVKEIVDSSGGTIVLSDRRAGTGLAVDVRLPRSRINRD